MSTRSLLASWVVAALIPALDTRADVSVRFQLHLESAAFPDLDSNPAIDGPSGSEHRFTANLVIESSGLADGAIQGWSLGVWHAGVDLVSISTEGTVTAEAEARVLQNNAFVKYEVVDPTRNGGKTGILQAVLLSFSTPIYLPPNSSTVVGKNLYQARVGDAGSIAFLRYEERLVGSGQPVQNAATVEGSTVYPTLSEKHIAIGQGAERESLHCDDDIDNDRNGWTDCNDPDCRLVAPCQPEVCGDGVDNDLDGLTDCQDPDCRQSVACPEICGDGEDNDQDGLVDCADSDCRGFPPCLEVCDDGIDQNGDGLIDCADPDCTGRPPCPGPERCRDGLDNDQDGKTDCADEDCRLDRACHVPEVCSDGIDNNANGLVDCADLDCRGSSACPDSEVCNDGLDNDRDGATDCDDTDCGTAAVCGGFGGGFDLDLAAQGSSRVRARNVVDAPLEGQPSVPVVVSIVPNPSPQPEGVQGWSLSISHDVGFMEFDPDGGQPTTSGTDAAALFSGGFEKTETTDPSRNPGSPDGKGGQGEAIGFISAVVLSLQEARALDPARAQSIVRAKYRLKSLQAAGDGGGGALSGGAHFEDGLRGSGQPVQNTLTVDGNSVAPLHFIPLEIRRGDRSSTFVRGDANGDRKVNIADAIWSVNELVRRGPVSLCPRAADFNADQLYDLADAVYLIHWLFVRGPPVPPPYPDCDRSSNLETFACDEGSVPYCN